MVPNSSKFQTGNYWVLLRKWIHLWRFGGENSAFGFWNYDWLTILLLFGEKTQDWKFWNLDPPYSIIVEICRLPLIVPLSSLIFFAFDFLWEPRCPIFFRAFAVEATGWSIGSTWRIGIGKCGAPKSKEVMSWNVLVKRVVNLNVCSPLHEIKRQNFQHETTWKNEWLVDVRWTAAPQPALADRHMWGAEESKVSVKHRSGRKRLIQCE